jgi:hypothetical protein
MDDLGPGVVTDVRLVGSEREFVELPNWRALGMAAAPAADTEASARSVARSNC